MTTIWSSFRGAALAYALAVLMAPSGAAARDGYGVVHAFTSSPDGNSPFSGVIADASGNLYGTTANGGKNFGTLYKIAPDGTETLLFTFPGTGNTGAFPEGRPLLLNGVLYGTTTGGGLRGVGTVYKLGADGKIGWLYQFCRKLKGDTCPDGAYPHNGLIADEAGNLYGVTTNGGIHGGGVVFKITQAGKLKVLYQLCAKAGCSDGYAPRAELIVDAAGNLYGTTTLGGASACSCGVAFKITAAGKYQVLHSFAGGSDGYSPWGGLVRDAAGNLYGTTTAGGNSGCAAGCGTVYRIAPDGSESVLYAFKGGMDGGIPLGQLLLDESGNLYGTTTAAMDEYGFGTVFKLSPTGKEKVLHNFCIDDGNCVHGIQPVAGVIQVGDTLYGTTRYGGVKGWGLVFKLAKK